MIRFLLGLLGVKKRIPVYDPRKDDTPATDKQRRYAKRLGVSLPPFVTKREATQLIGQRLERSSTARAIDQNAQRAKRVKQYGEERIKIIDAWDAAAERDEVYLAVFRQRGEVKADVLAASGASIKGKGVELSFSAPKIVKDRDIGDYVEFDRDVNLKPEDLLHFEVIKFDDIDATPEDYLVLVKRGQKLAKRFK